MRTRINVLIDDRLKQIARELKMVDAAVEGLTQALVGKKEYQNSLIAEQDDLIAARSEG